MLMRHFATTFKNTPSLRSTASDKCKHKDTLSFITKKICLVDLSQHMQIFSKAVQQRCSKISLNWMML